MMIDGGGGDGDGNIVDGVAHGDGADEDCAMVVLFQASSMKTLDCMERHFQAEIDEESEDASSKSTKRHVN